MEKLIGGIMILGGMVPLAYLIIVFYRKWKEKGNVFALKAIALIIVSLLLNTTGIIVCVGVIIIGFCLIVYT
ncbi:hypothetical protein QUF88_17270 [Bacillus sp. DX1.1]|uniref:hypothetical protein n=1 Tax=unclassified Bacillus (in: firmicutes) TaxID=185979 RepID=UPI0025700686|nr:MULTISPECIES: hypothetical protein [unclassified Bacillus (in: firmicutes)]MDM5155485.1 hypothetical protein [Bacillus sp. DX1.1]WJE79797.1 hypothetical protein QRE67_14795 [Bacillus sp. DX3.1]